MAPEIARARAVLAIPRPAALGRVGGARQDVAAVRGAGLRRRSPFRALRADGRAARRQGYSQLRAEAHGGVFRGARSRRRPPNVNAAARPPPLPPLAHASAAPRDDPPAHPPSRSLIAAPASGPP